MFVNGIKLLVYDLFCFLDLAPAKKTLIYSILHCSIAKRTIT